MFAGDRRVFLGVGLGLLLLLAFGWVGGVEATARAGLHVGMAGLLGVAATLPRSMLRRGARGALAGLGGLAVLALPLLLGFVPLSSGLAAVVAPGRVAASGDSWVWAASSLPDLLLALGGLLLVAGAWTLAAIWVDGADDREGSVERVGAAAVGGALGLIAVGLLHATFGLEDAFGWIQTSHTLSGRYFGPLVNPNHLGTVVAMAVPIAVWRVLHRGPAPGSWALLLVAGPVFVATGARAAALAALLTAAWMLGRSRGWKWVIGPLLVGLPAVVLWAVGAEAEKAESVAGRLRIWTDSLAALADHWLLGVGGGAFELAFEPYRTDLWANDIAHAHSEPLEWVVETGVVGLLGLGLAGVLGLRALGRPRRLASEALLCGAAAALLHGLVEFPLAIPAIALATAILASVGRRRRSAIQGRSRRLRAALVGLALGNAVAAGWSAHRGATDLQVARVRAAADAPARGDVAASWLERWAPWTGWDRLHRARAAARSGDHGGARALALEAVARAGGDDDRTRQAVIVLLAVRAEESLLLAERAVARGPADYRNHFLHARALRAAGRLDEALEAYVRGFERGAPSAMAVEAWEAFPVTVFWLDALEELPGPTAAMGTLWLSRADPEEALLAFDQASRVDPEGHGRIAARPRALVRVGRVEQALSSAEEYAADHPEDPRAAWILGDVRLEAGRPEEAAQAWRAVEDAIPEVRAHVVRAMFLAGGVAAAEREADRMRVSGRSGPAVELELARSYARAGQRVQCSVVAERLAPGSEEARLARRACAGVR